MISNLNDTNYCKELRRIFRISLETVAAIINCSEDEIAMWEEGVATLSKEKLRPYLKFLNEYRYNI